MGDSPSRFFGTPIDPNATNPSKLTAYEDSQPDFQMSFQNFFTIAKNLEVSFLLHWKNGGHISNLTRLLQDEGGTTEDWSEPSGQLDPTTGEELTNGEYRRGRTAREFIQDGSYVRLREVAVYYTIPLSLRTSLFKSYVQNIRLGVSGNNLLTFTDYVGYDPEVSNFGTAGNLGQVDVGGYPNTRRLFFHVGIDF